MRKETKTISRIFGLILSLCMIGTLLVTPAFAANDRATVYEQYDSVAATYRGETRTYPTKAGYVFAGWYADDAGTTALNAAAADAATTAWAKFVDQDVFSVKYQLPMGKSVQSDTVDLRIVSTVDNLKYKSVGFVITAGEKTVTKTTDTVYRTVTGFYNGTQLYTPSEFSAASGYFVAFNLKNVPQSIFDQNISIAATWTTIDGTEITAGTDMKRDITLSADLPDLYEGVSFDKLMDTGVVSQRTGITATDTIEIVDYQAEQMTAPASYGEKGLLMEHTSGWTHFRINFGKAVPADTVVSFNAYCADNATSPAFFFAVPESAGGARGEVGRFTNGNWANISFPLSAQTQASGEARYSDLGYVDLFYDNGTDGNEPWSLFYIDNVAISRPYALDITAGTIDFETAGMEAAIEKIDSTVGEAKRVVYSDEGMSYANGGSHGMKLENCTDYPHLRMNFGTALPVGTEITFDVYTTGFGAGHNFELPGIGNATTWFEDGTWTTLTVKVGYKLIKDWGTGSETLEQYATDPISYIDMFTGRENGTTKTVYIDNLQIKPAPYVYDITRATVTFDDAREIDYIGPYRVESWGNNNVNTAEIVEFGDGKSVKISGVNNAAYPGLTINFGKEIPAGSFISFDVYADVTGGPSNLKFEMGVLGGSLKNTKSFANRTWTTIAVTLDSATTLITGFMNADGASACDFYIDNLSYFLLDITKDTVTFDDANEINYIGPYRVESWGNNNVNTAEIVEFGDGKSVKISGVNNAAYPGLTIYFGKELPAGSIISFDAYADVTGGPSSLKFEMGAVSGSLQNTRTFANRTWTNVSIKLNSAMSLLTGFLNADGATACNLYIDNLSYYLLDITAGTIDFETSGMEAAITNAGSNFANADRVAYADAGLSVPASKGSHGMKLSGNTNRWPHMQIHFGTTLAAGGVISFEAYVDPTNVADHNTNIQYAQQPQEPRPEGAWKGHAKGEWTTYTVNVREQDVQNGYVQIFFDITAVTGGDDSTDPQVIYIDNLSYAAPAQVYVLDITQGVDFETSGMEAAITRSGSNFASAERVTYTDAGISAPANGGTYAMKLSGNTNRWPHFQIHFGTTLTEGSVITFEGYVDPTNVTSDNTNIAYDGGGFPEKHDADHPNGDWTAHAKGTWTSYEVYVRSTDVANGYVDLYFDIETAAGNSSTDPQVIYIDNLAYTPAS